MGFKGFKKDLGIDLGTANTLVFMKDKGIIVNEPSVVAVDTKTDEVLAVGDEAKKMIGKAPADIALIRPLTDGVVADFDTTARMLAYFLKKSLPRRNPFIYPRVVIGVPAQSTTVEKRAVIEAAMMAGAREAMIIEEPVAAAIGAGLDIEEPFGHLIVDIGGGTTEIAVISLGGIVVSDSLKVAGDEMDLAVAEYIKRQYKVSVGINTAEEVKIAIGAATTGDVQHVTVSGRDLLTGLPKPIQIGSDEVFRAIRDTLVTISDGVRNVLERTHPELSADIMVQGMTLTGGGSMIRDLDRFFARRLMIPILKQDDPLESVAVGTGRSLNHYDVIKKSMKNVRKR